MEKKMEANVDKSLVDVVEIEHPIAGIQKGKKCEKMEMMESEESLKEIEKGFKNTLVLLAVGIAFGLIPVLLSIL